MCIVNVTDIQVLEIPDRLMQQIMLIYLEISPTKSWWDFFPKSNSSKKQKQKTFAVFRVMHINHRKSIVN